jgi:putative ABC transport system permease protein
METFADDLRFALRQAWRRPGFTVLFVLILALGIGATSAMFAVVRGVLLADLPFHEPDRMVALYSPAPGLPRAPLSGPDFDDWRAGSNSFDALALTGEANVNVVVAGEAIRVPGAMIYGDYFRALGEDAALGQLLSNEDNARGAHAAVVSDDFFRKHLGADPALIGTPLLLEGEAYEIVGVLAPGVRFVGPRGEADIWFPVLSVPGVDDMHDERGAHTFNGLGRLKPGVSAEQAKAELVGIAARLEEEFPNTNTHRGAEVIDLKELLVGKSRSAILLLFGAIVFVLLLTCANAANLLLARASGRRGEIAMRAALGASRLRLVRQLLTEACALALLGGAVGALVGLWALDLFTWVLADMIPITARVVLDPRGLAFTFAVAAVAGVLAGIAPALSLSRPEAYEALKEGAARATVGSARSRLRAALVVAEVAIAIALLSGAGLLLKSYSALGRIDPGFDADQVYTGLVNLPRATFQSDESLVRFQEGVIAELRQTPGVVSAAAIDRIPQGNWGSSGDIIIEDGPEFLPGECPDVERRRATADYFSTMGIRIVRGRAFTDADTSTSAPVMIVNESFANRFFPGEDPIGKRARWNTDNLPLAEIVGVFADVRTYGPDNPPPLESFIPFAQHPDFYLGFVIKTAPGVDGGEALRSATQSVDPMQPLYRVRPMSAVSSARTSSRRSILVLLGVFAGIALLLAALGIYGVISHQTSQRTREVGIRLALGARPTDVVRLVVLQAMTTIGVGVGIGVAISIGASRLLASFLYGTSPLDPSVYAAVATALGLVGLFASAIPARRAATVAPASALRYE